MLHSNLLGRLGNGLLKFVVLVVMVCNVCGAFATTISSNTTLSSGEPYSDITVNPGVTVTITSEVTINGDLTNNGGTIIVGEGGVLTVTGNVTNTSAYSSEYTRTQNGPTTSTEPRGNSNNKRYLITTTEIIYTPQKNTGSISVTDGGSITINGDFSNASSLSITSTESDKISRVVTKGKFTNTTRNITGTATIQTTRVSQPQKYSYNSSSWNNDGTSTKDESATNNSISATAVGSINLSNGYLLVDGNLELQDNSTVTFEGIGIGEDIESTIRVRNISGTEGNVTQSENAVITLASGAKGEFIVAGVYYDKTTLDNTDTHPWKLDNDMFLISEGFHLLANGYDINGKVISDADITEEQEKINQLKQQLEDKNIDLDEYLKILYPEEYRKFDTGTYTSWGRTYTYRSKYNNSFSRYLFEEDRNLWSEFLKGLVSWDLSDFLSMLSYNYDDFVSDMTEAALIELRQTIQDEEEILATMQALKKLLEEGINSNDIPSTMISISTLLPIELTSFTATATDYGFEFNWVTASEVENDYFTLEYSIDGVDFSEIDYVHGAGTTSETSEYEYRWDEAPEFDVVYFRLKQTDYNGEYSYSDVVVASRKKSSGANGTFRYGPLNLQIVDGELRYIQK